MTKKPGRGAVGIDLGGTTIRVASVDDDGHIHSQIRMAADVTGGFSAIIDQIVKAVLEMKNESPFLSEGIGVGVAGQVEPKTGNILFAPNLKWSQVHLQKILGESLNMPVIVTNDLRAITYGEMMHGAGKNRKHFICLFVGTGIGAGIVSDGRLLEGSTGSFGEVGHMIINPDGPLCTCGGRGCWEAYAGGWGIAARAVELLIQNNESSGTSRILQLVDGDRQAVTGKTVFRAFVEGDPTAKIIIDQMRSSLNIGCTNLVNLFNPSLLVLGGGVIDGFPELIDSIREGVSQMALKSALSGLEITRARLGGDAGVIGAASLFLGARSEF